jgi:uncharacterized protein YqjF (DUF2071 family)
MNSIKKILLQNKQRPYPIPDANWKYYQEWHDVIFIHWKAPVEEVRRIVPTELDLDLYDGMAWISLVAFTIKKLRPHYFPAFPPVSDFHEINMRTYVKKKGKQGIYFLSVEADKRSSALLSRAITGLPYVRSEMTKKSHLHKSYNTRLHYYLQLKYEPDQSEYKKDFLDKWLTERYCVYHKLKSKIISYDIHHVEWPLQNIKIDDYKMNYSFGNLLFHNLPASRYHFSKGVNVLTWAKHKII